MGSVTRLVYINHVCQRDERSPAKTSYLLHLFNDEPNCGVF